MKLIFTLIIFVAVFFAFKQYGMAEKYIDCGMYYTYYESDIKKGKQLIGKGLTMSWNVKKSKLYGMTKSLSESEKFTKTVLSPIKKSTLNSMAKLRLCDI